MPARGIRIGTGRIEVGRRTRWRVSRAFALRGIEAGRLGVESLVAERARVAAEMKSRAVFAAGDTYRTTHGPFRMADHFQLSGSGGLGGEVVPPAERARALLQKAFKDRIGSEDFLAMVPRIASPTRYGSVGLRESFTRLSEAAMESWPGIYDIGDDAERLRSAYYYLYFSRFLIDRHRFFTELGRSLPNGIGRYSIESIEAVTLGRDRGAWIGLLQAVNVHYPWLTQLLYRVRSMRGFHAADNAMNRNPFISSISDGNTRRYAMTMQKIYMDERDRLSPEELLRRAIAGSFGGEIFGCRREDVVAAVLSAADPLKNPLILGATQEAPWLAEILADAALRLYFERNPFDFRLTDAVARYDDSLRTIGPVKGAEIDIGGVKISYESSFAVDGDGVEFFPPPKTLVDYVRRWGSFDSLHLGSVDGGEVARVERDPNEMTEEGLGREIKALRERAVPFLRTSAETDRAVARRVVKALNNLEGEDLPQLKRLSGSPELQEELALLFGVFDDLVRDVEGLKAAIAMRLAGRDGGIVADRPNSDVAVADPSEAGEVEGGEALGPAGELLRDVPFSTGDVVLHRVYGRITVVDLIERDGAVMVKFRRPGTTARVRFIPEDFLAEGGLGYEEYVAAAVKKYRDLDVVIGVAWIELHREDYKSYITNESLGRMRLIRWARFLDIVRGYVKTSGAGNCASERGGVVMAASMVDGVRPLHHRDHILRVFDIIHDETGKDPIVEGLREIGDDVGSLIRILQKRSTVFNIAPDLIREVLQHQMERHGIGP